MTGKIDPFKRLVEFCEGELDFEVTLALKEKPARNKEGRLRKIGCEDARLAIEIFNAKGDKVVQIRQDEVSTIADLAIYAFDVLESKGFIK